MDSCMQISQKCRISAAASGITKTSGWPTLFREQHGPANNFSEPRTAIRHGNKNSPTGIKTHHLHEERYPPTPPNSNPAGALNNRNDNTTAKLLWINQKKIYL